jgi:hypothetical protein
VTAIKAIETFYCGTLYRSKLEACWAAFFDALSVRHEYELDAFVLPSGNYTPDFWLPDADDKLGVWVEIKGKEPTAKAIKKCIDLNNGTGRKVAILVGQPMMHVRAQIGEANALLFSDGGWITLSNTLGYIAPTAAAQSIHHAAVTAHAAVRWSADIGGKINKANTAWSKRR